MKYLHWKGYRVTWGRVGPWTHYSAPGQQASTQFLGARVRPRTLRKPSAIIQRLPIAGPPQAQGQANPGIQVARIHQETPHLREHPENQSRCNSSVLAPEKPGALGGHPPGPGTPATGPPAISRPPSADTRHHSTKDQAHRPANLSPRRTRGAGMS